jgi:hypothetical protein
VTGALDDDAGLDDPTLAQQMLPYLLETGWIESRRLRRPVDRELRPIPWITYPAIDFLAERVTKDMSVFEFGSGNSTLWWADRVAHVCCVEHDPGWADEIRSSLPANVDLYHVELDSDGEYCRVARETGRRFHVVVVDGRDRANCAIQSIDSLRSDGVIVWDNTERRRYRVGLNALRKRGFRRLRFRGPTPIDTWASETSVLYRPGNCLGL